MFFPSNITLRTTYRSEYDSSGQVAIQKRSLKRIVAFEGTYIFWRTEESLSDNIIGLAKAWENVKLEFLIQVDDGCDEDDYLQPTELKDKRE